MTNYITRAGAKKLQEEIVRLRSGRPKVVQDVADAAAQGDRSENAEYIYGKKKLREIDRRIHFLTKRLEAAQVVELEDEDGAKMRYQIVGEDEIDLKRNRISWRSPLGRTLLGKKVDDVVVFRRPSGEVELTLLSVRYDITE